MLEGVDVEISKNMKDELTLTGNSLEKVSQSAADIQQICRVKNKDIRKVSNDTSAESPHARSYTDAHNSSWTVFTCRSGGISRTHRGWGCAMGKGKSEPQRCS